MPRARCRSCPRPPRSRWPRPRRGSGWAPPSPSCAPKGCCPGRVTAARCRPDSPISVKEAVMPWSRFRTPDGQGVDVILGPEMRSTGEVMGIDADFGKAFAKSQAGAYGSLPLKGRVFVSVANRDKRSMVFPVKALARPGLRDPGHRRHRRRAAPQRHPGHHGAQALAGHRPERRADDRAADRGRRDRPDHQHALRRRARGWTATRSAPRRSRPASRASPRSRASRRRCTASRRCGAARSGVGSLQEYADELNASRAES